MTLFTQAFTKAYIGKLMKVGVEGPVQ
jgi:hypothetical protein